MPTAKSIDRGFVHYGIRADDLSVIRKLCKEHCISDEWFIEKVLKKYHEAKVTDFSLAQKQVEKIINSALSQIEEN